MLALAGPSRRRKCPDVAPAKSGIESFSNDTAARSTCLAVALPEADVTGDELLALVVVERIA
jgi:hypothetical protein